MIQPADRVGSARAAVSFYYGARQRKETCPSFWLINSPRVAVAPFTSFTVARVSCFHGRGAVHCLRMGRRFERTGMKSVGELAETAEIKECLQWFDRNKQWLNERHLQLCKIPAPTFREQQRAAWMVTQLTELGCDVHFDGVGNVVAKVPGLFQGPYIALTAHLDTVLSPRIPEDISVGADGKFYGPGVSDNGAGLAALLAIARVFPSCSSLRDFRCGLLLIANVGEEGEGNLSGMRWLCQKSPLARNIRAFLVLDGPAMDHITCRALESRRFEISFSGQGGHSWNDRGIANPICALSRLITIFCDQAAALTSSTNPRTAYNFGVIEGGTSVNAIPSLASVKLDIRSEDPSHIEKLALLLGKSAADAREIENRRVNASKLTLKIKEIGRRPGGAISESSPLLRHLRAVDAYFGIRARLDCSSTDANIPLSMGLPAVSIGAGGQGGGAHTHSEWFHPQGREIGLKRIFLSLCLLMQDPEVAAIAE